MKNAKTLTVILLLALAVLASCEEAQDYATLRVNLQKDRSIVPEDYPLEITSYRVSGTGPSGASFSVETSRETVSLEGLVIGEWNLLAEGLNSRGDTLVTGETVHRLSATNGSTVIVLKDLVGEGSLSITLSWDPERLSGTPSVEMELTPQYGGRTPVPLELTELNAEEGTASYSGDGYAAGSYILSARLYSGSVQVAGFVEAVRIAGDQTSEGEIGFDLDKYPTEPGVLELVNQTGIPVTCTISGMDDTVTAGEPVSVSISSETDDVGDFSISWYLNGIHIGDGESVEFTPETGVHRLDVVASTSRLGTSGSSSMNFEAVQASDPGIPASESIIEENGTLSMGAGAIMRFLPDGKVMIISNEKKTVQIAAVIRNNLDVVREYTFSSIGITGTVSGFASVDISATLSKVVVGQNDPLNIIVYNYNPQSTSLSMFSESGGAPDFPYSEEEAAEVVGVWAAEGLEAGGCEPGIIMLKNKDGDRITGTYMNLNEKTGDDEQFYGAIGGSGAVESGPKLLSGSVAEDGSLFLYDHEFVIATQRSYLSPSDTEYMQSTANIISLNEEDQYIMSGAMCATHLDTETMLLAGDYISVVDISFGEIWEVLSEERNSSVIHALTTTGDFSYVYYIDATYNELVTLEIRSGGTSFAEIGRTALTESGLDTIALSESGTNMMLYNSRNADSVTMMRVSRL